MDKSESSNLRLYFIFSYLMFWCLLGLTGILISLKVPSIVQDVMKNICAWSPTFVLLILFKKLLPGVPFRDFMRMSFGRKIKWIDLILSVTLQLMVLAGIVGAYLLINRKPFNSLVFINLASILPVFLITITAGPIGEELGWRGYALGVLQKRYSPFGASMILGLLWGLWHLPLWLLSGYSGTDLLIYSVAFMAAIIATSILITYFYNKSRNVLIAVWIHFFFNFLLKIVVIDILPMLLYSSVGYLLIAIAITALNKNTMLKKPKLAGTYRTSGVSQ
jgi:membrane protease YdiL (CAAX protease family)